MAVDFGVIVAAYRAAQALDVLAGVIYREARDRPDVREAYKASSVALVAVERLMPEGYFEGEEDVADE